MGITGVQGHVWHGRGLVMKGTNMEKIVSNYLDLGNLQLRKWQTIEITGDLHLDALRWELPQ